MRTRCLVAGRGRAQRSGAPRLATATIVAALLCAVPRSADATDRDKPFVGVTAEELYDSNVNNSRGADAVSRVTPEAGLMHEGPVTKIVADYRLAMHAYATGAADSTINHRGALQIGTKLGPRVDANAGGILLVADDPVLLDRPGVAVAPGGFDDLTLSAGATGALTRRWKLDGTYAFRRTRWSQASAMIGVFDSDEHDGAIGATWRWTRRLDVGGRVLGQDFVTYGSAMGDSQTIAPVASLAWQASHTIRLSGWAGPEFFLGRATTWTGDARAVWQGRKLRATLTLDRTIFGGTGAQGAVWSDYGRLGVVWRLHRRTAIRLVGGAFAQGIAPDANASVTGLMGRVEWSFLAFGKNTRIDVYAEQRMQDASGGTAFTNIERTFVGIRLVAMTGVDLFDLGEVP